ncbi:unnamed protein product [Lathyrus oleraceus]
MRDPSRSLNCNPYPLSSHEKWKRARQRPYDSFTSEATREVTEKIDVLVEQSKVDIFIPRDRHDILVEAIGTKENDVHVCVLGRGVDLKIHFGPSQSINKVKLKREIQEIVIEKLGVLLE